MTFELGWNLLKDFLEEEGFSEIKTPRAAIKKAFETELISDGHSWLKALEDRNLTSHTYDETAAVKIEMLIRNDYYPLLKELYDLMKSK